MTEAVTISLVTGGATVLVAGIAAVVSYKTHKAVNSRMDEFKRIAEKMFKAEGILQEKADEERRKVARTK